MKLQAHVGKSLVESITPNKIILNAAGKFPRDVIFGTEEEEAKIYRLVKTKSGGLTLNK